MATHSSASDAGAPAIDLARDLLAQASALLLDWDGCLAFDDRLAPGARAFLKQNIDRVAIVSNNTTRLPQDFAALLAMQGVRLPLERILLAGHETVQAAAEEAPAARTLLLGNARLRRLARVAGLDLGAAEPELVVLLRDTGFTYAKLQAAVGAVSCGARLYVGNPDLTHPGANGLPVPETGALLAALSAAVNLDDAQVQVIGKPGPVLFRRACKALGIAPEQAVMIGDNASTDQAGALALGMPALLVGNGSVLSLRALL